MNATTIQEAMRKLGSTDGKGGTTWDPGVLEDAAKACLAGDRPNEFEGGPEDMSEYNRFAKAWIEIQSELVNKIAIKKVAQKLDWATDVPGKTAEFHNNWQSLMHKLEEMLTMAHSRRPTRQHADAVIGDAKQLLVILGEQIVNAIGEDEK